LALKGDSQEKASDGKGSFLQVQKLT